MAPAHRSHLIKVALLAVIAGGLAVWIAHVVWPNKPNVVVKPATTEATQVAATSTAPATTQAAVIPPPRTLLDLIHRHQPGYAATQPLAFGDPLGFHECGHFILREPVYLDAANQLWITRPDADDTETRQRQLPRSPASR